MPSKTSKPARKTNSRSKPDSAFSRKPTRQSLVSTREPTPLAEDGLRAFAFGLASELRPGDRLLLRGPLGVGKTTLARGLLLGLGIDRESEGSPTFAVAHTYEVSRGGAHLQVLHMDLYRMTTESELEERGIVEALWNPDQIVVVEWMEKFPALEASLNGDSQFRVITCELAFTSDPATRSVVLK